MHSIEKMEIKGSMKAEWQKDLFGCVLNQKKKKWVNFLTQKRNQIYINAINRHYECATN